MSQLRIWIADPVDGPWPWHNTLGNSGTAYTDEDKSQLAGQDFRTIDIILPGQSVRIFEHELPKMRDNERQSAAGFFVEDKIAASLSDQHVALSGTEDNRVGVMGAEKLNTLIQTLFKFGLRPSAAYADFDVFRDAKQSFLIGDRVIYPGPLGHSLDAAWSDTPELEAQLPDALGEILTDHALNFLSGRFAPRQSGPIDFTSFYRAAALALFAGIAGLSLLFVESRAVNQQADYLKEETARIYAEHTGQTAPANPALAVTRALKTKGNQQADFLKLSDILITSIETLDGIIVDSLQFDKNRNQLNLRLVYPNFESAGELERAVTQSGGVFRPGGVREQGGRLIGTASLLARSSS